MPYADNSFYTESYHGDVLPSENADRWLEAASDELDALTFGRLTFAFPTIAAHVSKVKKAVCAVAEALYKIDVQRKAVAATEAEDGTYRGAVASVSSGRESISYVNGSSSVSASVYAAAAANMVEHNKLISSIAVKYLANIPDSSGVNLLYAGEVRHVPQYDNPV